MHQNQVHFFFKYITVMQKDLELLLKLQEIDYTIGELERSKGYLPDMVQELQRQIEEAGILVKTSEERLTQLKLENKKLEIELQTWETELAKYQSQMKVIKTNKEYDALMAEMEMRKTKISKGEDELLKIMNEIEELEAKIPEYKQQASEVKKTNQAQLSELKKEIDSISTKIKIKADERKNVAVRVAKAVAAIYERVRKGKGEVVVVSVRKNACSGCYKSLPPQVIQEIKKGDGIICCDNCGRILIWSADFKS